MTTDETAFTNLTAIKFELVKKIKGLVKKTILVQF